MSDEIKETMRILSHEEAEKMLYELGGELETPAGTVQVVVRHLEAMPPILRHSWRFRGSGNPLWPVAPVANGRDLIEAIREAVNAHVNNTGRGAPRPSEARVWEFDRIKAELADVCKVLGADGAMAADAAASVVADLHAARAALARNAELRRELDEAVRLIGVRTAERDEARGLLDAESAARRRVAMERNQFDDRMDEIANVLSDEPVSGESALELAKEAMAALRDARSRLDQAAQLLGERTAERDEARKEMEARRAADGMVGERNVELERRLAQAERAENGNEVLAGALDNLRKEIGAGAEESTAAAVLRVVRDRDAAVMTLELARSTLSAKPEESTVAAARRLVDALQVAEGQLRQRIELAESMLAGARADAAQAEAKAAALQTRADEALLQRDGLDDDLSAEQRKREAAEEQVKALTKGVSRAQSDAAKAEKSLAELGRRYDDLVSRIGAALASAAMVGRDVFVSKGADRG